MRELDDRVRRELVRLLADLFSQDPMARGALAHIGFPEAAIPPFHNAELFWPLVVQELEKGRVRDGILRLLTYAQETYSQNPDVAKLLAALGQPAGPGAGAAEPRLLTDGPCPTLVLVGADDPAAFLQIVRAQIDPDAELLYVSREQSAVRISDPGDQASEIRSRLQHLLEELEPGCEVVFEQYPFRPYLYRQLIVLGPDGTPYTFGSVPATTLPEDIAAAVVQYTQEAMTSRRGGTVRTVIDHETGADGERHRLDPQVTLHEAGVKEGDRLRVGAEATAGAISPNMRAEAQQRIRAQIRRYALNTPDFEIIDYDNEELPNRISVEFVAPGFAPPEDLAEFAARAKGLSAAEFVTLPFDTLRPIPITRHRLSIYLGENFPVAAPAAIWDIDVFHPNIWRDPRFGPKGQVCLGPLMSGWRPDLDFYDLCQLLVEIGSYQNYDVVEAEDWPDSIAAFWARTEPGQAAIIAIGGTLMDHRPSGPPPESARVRPRGFYAKPLGS